MEFMEVKKPPNEFTTMIEKNIYDISIGLGIGITTMCDYQDKIEKRKRVVREKI